MSERQETGPSARVTHGGGMLEEQQHAGVTGPD